MIIYLFFHILHFLDPKPSETPVTGIKINPTVLIIIIAATLVLIVAAVVVFIYLICRLKR